MIDSKGLGSWWLQAGPDANVEEGVQDRRCKPNVEPVEARWTPTWTPSPPHCTSPPTSCCSAPRSWHPGGQRSGSRPSCRMPSWSPWRCCGPARLGSEARWLRYARAHLGELFPYLPKQPGYNKRLRAAADLLRHVTRVLASDTSWWTDDVWVADSTPVECGRSRQTTKRSDL